jgi:hypothetical protein
MTIYFKNKLNNLVILYMFASKSKFTRVNQINQNKFGSYYHSNSSKFLNKVFETTEEEIILKEPTIIIQEELLKDEKMIPPSPKEKPEELIILNKMDTEEPVIDKLLPMITIIENPNIITEKALLIEPHLIEPMITTPKEPIIIIEDDDDKNHIELSDLYDQTPEENLVITYINENFRENSIKKEKFLASNFVKSKSWK